MPMYVVRFSEPNTEETLHRVRNFAEDVFRSLRDDGLGTVPNMDTAVNEVHVEVRLKRQAGRVGQILRRHLRDHRFSAATIERM